MGEIPYTHLINYIQYVFREIEKFVYLLMG
ncbi:hypothetical protein SAMN05192552_1004211 [Natrinema hispanicum]|uniref:Uncharacterized protein n=1 Tax=Natrinema hispanicum TaxID=392421 RepID=A0A1G6M7U6_9EURY|nr:hypothetical protein SAMN05192552_1004211 [Natrinema hispanicum]